MHMDSQTELPVIIDDKCVSCGDVLRHAQEKLLNYGKKQKRREKSMWHVQTKIKGELQEKPAKWPASHATNVSKLVNSVQ